MENWFEGLQEPGSSGCVGDLALDAESQPCVFLPQTPLSTHRLLPSVEFCSYPLVEILAQLSNINRNSTLFRIM